MIRVGCYMLGAGIDATQFDHVLYAMKPMDVMSARQLIASAINALTFANANVPTGLFVEDQSQAIARRKMYIADLQNKDALLLAAAKHLPGDIVPETAAAPLRDAIARAITEFNSVAEGNETLSGAQEKLLDDMKQNAINLAKRVGNAAMAVVDTAEAAGKQALWYTKVTYWVLIGLGVGVTGLIAFGMYKGLSSGKLRVR